MRLLLVEDLEWWFHGPPSERHLMHMLTGANRLGSFSFVPQRVSTIGAQVFVEGQGATPKACWVHVWTVKSGLLAELREYFNTSVTVTGCENSETFKSKSSQGSDQCIPFNLHQPIWQSKFTGHSMPELILAI
ncbi:hypothetical protein O6H91_05G122800 [Diphasiastrum complanatum]|uniref:Uncharacterized protein n=1 Tax=Diphasiastrum complanatum TaxID=34168 RepID=A0ACC2DSU7_DIPCM|nr:hypothetical protein O6H91_05G122800 [Diphasiastrum complanatum]